MRVDVEVQVPTGHISDRLRDGRLLLPLRSISKASFTRPVQRQILVSSLLHHKLNLSFASNNQALFGAYHRTSSIVL